MRVRKLFPVGPVLLAIMALATLAGGQQSTRQLAANAGESAAPDPTFTRDVLPIFQKNCQVCHRPNGANMGGMVAPMSLRTYEEVRPYAQKIATFVEARYMLPWHASPDQHGLFKGERVLSQAEIDTIVGWVRSGAPEGDPADAPPPVSFASDTSGWAIGEPDLIVQFDQPYLVGDDVVDEYVDIEVVIPAEMLPEDKWIKAVEFRPGSSVVHHIIANPLGGIAPGYEPRIYDDGYSRLLRRGTVVTFNMHYHKEAGEGTAVYDQTMVAVTFYEPGEEIQYVVESDMLGTLDFVIPANDPNYSDMAFYLFRKDAHILWFNPHMHLRGKAARYVVTFPDASQQLLLEVPEYDFNWQETYRFKEPVFVPRGTRIDLTLWWDNSADNPSNPNPNRDVRWGRPTTDEMGFGFVTFVDVEPRNDIIVGKELPRDLRRRTRR